MVENGPKLSNSSLLNNLGVKLDHLSGKEQGEMEHLLPVLRKFLVICQVVQRVAIMMLRWDTPLLSSSIHIG